MAPLLPAQAGPAASPRTPFSASLALCPTSVSSSAISTIPVWSRRRRMQITLQQRWMSIDVPPAASYGLNRELSIDGTAVNRRAGGRCALVIFRGIVIGYRQRGRRQDGCVPGPWPAQERCPRGPHRRPCPGTQGGAGIRPHNCDEGKMYVRALRSLYPYKGSSDGLGVVREQALRFDARDVTARANYSGWRGHCLWYSRQWQMVRKKHHVVPALADIFMLDALIT